MNVKLANACSQEEIHHSKFLILLRPHILPQLARVNLWLDYITYT